MKLDDRWKEKGRFTYPPAIIERLGKYSLSCGIWRKGVLLVTGQDDPLVFRVSLPESGAVLVFLGTQKVPFPGQGIATDPKTGGLVGIHRAKRLVVFAEPH